MPAEAAKEVAKVVVETSGSLAEWWRWIIGGLAAGVVTLWGKTSDRFRRLEETSVTAAQLKEHVDMQNRKFEELFDETRTIGKAVARIEGMLDK